MTRLHSATRRIAAASALACLVAAPAALADSVYERFVNFHYIISELDGEGDSVDSELAAGFQINSTFWDYGRLIAEVDIRKFDEGSVEFDVQNASLGIGAGTMIADRFYVLGAVSYDDYRFRIEDNALSAPDNSVGPLVITDSIDGLGFQVGVGAEVIESVEVFARYKTIKFDVDGDGEDTESLIRVGARWAALERLNLLVEYETYDELEITDIRIGFGLTFGG